MLPPHTTFEKDNRSEDSEAYVLMGKRSQLREFIGKEKIQ